MDFHVSLIGRKDLTGEIHRQLRRAVLDRPPTTRRSPARRRPPDRNGRRNFAPAADLGEQAR